MTTLPRLAPAETSIASILQPGISHGDPKRKSISSIGYRELSNSWGGSATHHFDGKPISHTARGALGRSFPRLDPLHPPKDGRTVSLETTNPHFQNELRSLNMKREQYHKYHRSWMKPIYGSKLEQEDYRRHIRSSLKDQMHEKVSTYKTFMKDRVVESETAVAYDKKCLDTDRDSLKNKSLYLHQFRDENKKLMEKRWQESRQSRDHSNRVEQELLRYNPINWTQSLR